LLKFKDIITPRILIRNSEPLTYIFFAISFNTMDNGLVSLLFPILGPKIVSSLAEYKPLFSVRLEDRGLCPLEAESLELEPEGILP